MSARFLRRFRSFTADSAAVAIVTPHNVAIVIAHAPFGAGDPPNIVGDAASVPELTPLRRPRGAENPRPPPSTPCGTRRAGRWRSRARRGTAWNGLRAPPVRYVIHVRNTPSSRTSKPRIARRRPLPPRRTSSQTISSPAYATLDTTSPDWISPGRSRPVTNAVDAKTRRSSEEGPHARTERDEIARHRPRPGRHVGHRSGERQLVGAHRRERQLGIPPVDPVLHEDEADHEDDQQDGERKRPREPRAG